MYALASARSSSRLLLQRSILPRAVAAAVPNGAMAGHPKSFTIGDKLSAKVRPHLSGFYMNVLMRKHRGMGLR
jgi:hypothetical protein